MKIPDDICRSDIVSTIYEWVIGQNAERDRQIMMRRLIDGVVFEKLAEEFELSDRQVKNIVYRHQEKIFRHIHK